MRTDDLVTAVLAVLLVAPTAAGAQQAGYANTPFRDYPVAVAQGAALERIELAARALAVARAGDDDDDDDDDDDQGEVADGREEEEEEGGPLADFDLLRASLVTASPELAAKLGDAIEEMAEAADHRTDVDEAAKTVTALTGEARDQVLSSELAETPGFQAALMASLLLEEGGVAESYEEATEGEAQAYAAGYFALQRVKALWQGLADKASLQQAADAQAMLAMLDGLFPAQNMPEQLSPDPEQAEAPAQQLVGVLEGVADAELYLGRDLATASGVVHDLAAQGCASLETAQVAVGVEQLQIAAAYYAHTMSDTLGLMAPETADAIREGLEEIGEGDAGEPAEACGPLLQALTEGKAALTP
jgi:hypothetical protein